MTILRHLPPPFLETILRHLPTLFSRMRPKSVSRSDPAQNVFLSLSLVYLALRLSTRVFFRSLISCIRYCENQKKPPLTLGNCELTEICTLPSSPCIRVHIGSKRLLDLGKVGKAFLRCETQPWNFPKVLLMYQILLRRPDYHAPDLARNTPERASTYHIKSAVVRRPVYSSHKNSLVGHTMQTDQRKGVTSHM